MAQDPTPHRRPEARSAALPGAGPPAAPPAPALTAPARPGTHHCRRRPRRRRSPTQPAPVHHAAPPPGADRRAAPRRRPRPRRRGAETRPAKPERRTEPQARRARGDAEPPRAEREAAERRLSLAAARPSPSSRPRTRRESPSARAPPRPSSRPTTRFSSAEPSPCSPSPPRAHSCSPRSPACSAPEREQMPLRRLILLLVRRPRPSPAGSRRRAAAPDRRLQLQPRTQDCAGWHRDERLPRLDPSPGTPCRLTAAWTPCDDRTPKGSRLACVRRTMSNATIKRVRIRVDKTPRGSRSVRPSRPPDSNGWYRAPVACCSAATTPHPGSAVSDDRDLRAARHAAGRAPARAWTSPATAAPRRIPAALRRDRPRCHLRHARPQARLPRLVQPPVIWRFTGRDGLSGLADCPAVIYSGPGGRAARVIGACRDKAGNVGDSQLRAALRRDPAGGADACRRVPRDHAVRLRIRAARRRPPHQDRSQPPAGSGKRHSTIYSGRPRSFTDRRVRNGKTYRYTVIARDQAANRSRTVVIVRAGPVLVSPPDGAVLAAPPRLEWSRVRDADYFNVQLRRDGRKVLSVWPRRSKLQLRSQWRCARPAPAARARALRVGRLARLRPAPCRSLRPEDRQPHVRHSGSTPSAVRSSTGSANEHEP